MSDEEVLNAATARLRYHEYLLLAKGIADYRARRIEQSTKWLRACREKARPSDAVALADLFLAMNCHQSGEKEEAERLLQEAGRRIDSWNSDGQGGDLGPNWHSWLICEIVRSEAETLVRSGSGGSPSAKHRR